MIKRIIKGSILADYKRRKVIVLSGARQVGKTTLLSELQEGKEKVLSLNCDNTDDVLLLEGKTTVCLNKSYLIMRYIVFFLLLICTISAKAQIYESCSNICSSTTSFVGKDIIEMNQQEWYKQSVYWKRHKKLRIYAFSVLGIGVCGTITGLIGELSNTAHTNSNWKEDGKAWDVVLGVGIGLTVSSIPLFVISHKNKKKLWKRLSSH